MGSSGLIAGVRKPIDTLERRLSDLIDAHLQFTVLACGGRSKNL
jgi:hypothetical protein